MKQLDINEIREIELDLLKKFKQFCETNNIRYFLSNGSLLGAVKYRGFIPWDDDIDVFVPRKDYDKLIQIFTDDETYSLLSFERNQKFRYPFAKFCNMKTRKIEDGFDNGIELGIDIDVFPLDKWENDLSRAKREEKQIRNLMFGLGLSKLKKADSLHPIKRIIKSACMCISKAFGSEFFLKRIIHKSRETSSDIVTYLGCKAWPIYGAREIIPAEAFSKTTEVVFEKELYPAPEGYDLYLMSLYGDYEEDPPPEKQKTHHSFKAYRR